MVVWSLTTYTEVVALRQHTHVVESVAFPPQGTELKLEGAAKVHAPKQQFEPCK